MTVDDLFQGTALHRDWVRALFRRAKRIVLACAAFAVIAEMSRPTRSTWHDALMYLALPTWLLLGLFSFGWPPRANAQRQGNAFLLRFTPGWRYGLRAILIVPFAALILMGLPRAPEEPIAACVMISLFVAAAVFGFLLPRELFLVTSSGVDRTSPWTGRVTTLRWPEVANVELDGFRRIVMRGPARILKVSLLLEGAGDFAAQALTSLSAPVLDAGTNVRPALEAVAARRSAGAQGEELDRASSRVVPMPVLVTAALLVAAGVSSWSLSQRFEAALRIPIPAGWVDLSPGATERNFEGFPESIREQATKRNVVAFAAEVAGTTATAGLVVQIHNGELDVASAEQKLGQVVATAIPNAHIVSQGVESVAGARVVRAEVSSSDRSAFFYAVPVIARTAIVVFTCVPTECARVREIAAASVSSIQGLAEPTFRNRYAGPLVRSSAMVAIFAAIYLGLVAVVAAFRRRRSTRTAGLPDFVPSTPVIEVPVAPGALRRTALIIWGALLGGSVLFIGSAVAVQPRSMPSDVPRALTATLAALSLVAVAVSFLIPRLVRDRPGSSAESSALTRHIAALAACEASVLLAAVGFLLNRKPVTLVFALAGIVGFLVAFPTMRRWASLRRDGNVSVPPMRAGS